MESYELPNIKFTTFSMLVGIYLILLRNYILCYISQTSQKK